MVTSGQVVGPCLAAPQPSWPKRSIRLLCSSTDRKGSSTVELPVKIRALFSIGQVKKNCLLPAKPRYGGKHAPARAGSAGWCACPGWVSGFTGGEPEQGSRPG